MTVFDISGEAPGAWFDFDGGGRVHLRSMSADRLKAIRKQTVKVRVEYKRIEGRAERFEVDETNNELENALFWDYVIQGWENFFDSKGAEIPCTAEMKLLLLDRSAKFNAFVAEKLKFLAEEEGRQQEAAAENFLPGSSGLMSISPSVPTAA